MPLTNPDGPIQQTVQAILSADVTVTAAGTYSDLATTSITTGANYIICYATFATSDDTGATDAVARNICAIDVDGTTVASIASSVPAGAGWIDQPVCCTVLYRALVTKGTHTVKCKLARLGTGNHATCRPLTKFEHNQITIWEVTD